MSYVKHLLGFWKTFSFFPWHVVLTQHLFLKLPQFKKRKLKQRKKKKLGSSLLSLSELRGDATQFKLLHKASFYTSPSSSRCSHFTFSTDFLCLGHNGQVWAFYLHMPQMSSEFCFHLAVFFLNTCLVSLVLSRLLFVLSEQQKQRGFKEAVRICLLWSHLLCFW